MVTRKPTTGPVDDIQRGWEDMGPAQRSGQTANAAQDYRGLPSSYPSQSSDIWEDERTSAVPTPQPQSLQPLQPTYTGTNPFLRQQNSLPSLHAPAPSTDVPPVPDHNALAQLSIQHPSNNPWQPALDQLQPQLYQPKPQPYQSQPSPLLSQHTSQDTQSAWSSQLPQNPTSSFEAKSPALISLSSDHDPAWDEVQKPMPTGSTQPSAELNELFEDSHTWDDLGHVDGGKNRATNQTPSSGSLHREAQQEGWSLVDSASPSQAPTLTAPSVQPDQPSLPPRESAAGTSRPFTRVGEDELKETYQIKKISWVDPKASKNPRTSPILLQNVNGPCPLLALVNALALTAAQDSESSLVNVLRSREQVTLGLLLDAVFEELMSRNVNPDAPLPDVSLLYSFLKDLHTGMNVNPRYLPTEELRRTLKRTSLTHVHPSERDDFIPGTFESTTEQQLYSTFAIPLVHGWIPKSGEPAYEAFERQAASYEDVQHLLFREEELEQKLHRDVMEMTEEEQQLYQDILTIKSFLSMSATQLTEWGLEVVTKVIEPGSFAILFRNDHFSTLYKHPQTLQLLQLVTDAGYASHKDVVWESLVDVNGERAEFLSGDFQVVSGAQGHAVHDSQQAGTRPSRAPPGLNDNDWPALGGSAGRSGATTPNTWQAQGGGDLSAREQEDRDLAFALQLQEEEDARQREDQARRRRESQLSEQYIEQQGRQPPITPPNRRTSNLSTRNARGPSPPARRTTTSISTPQTSRPSVPLTYRPSDDADDAPPSYDEAAKTRPYQPPVGHPSHPASTTSQNNTPSSAPTPARTSRTSVTSTTSTRSAAANGARPAGSTAGSPAASRSRPSVRTQAGSNPGYPGSGPRPSPPRQFSQFSPSVGGSSDRYSEREREEKCVVM